MTPRAELWLGAIGAALAAAPLASATAQFATLSLPGGDTVPAAPRLVARSIGVTDALRPITLQLDIATSPSFNTLIYSESRTGDNATFLLPRLLPQNSTVYFRLLGIAAGGFVFSTETSAAHHVGPWLSLVSPNGLNNITVVGTRRPTFVWHSSPVTVPPGPWLYELSVVNVATQVVDFFAQFLRDTVYTVPAELQANTSYRWSVIARLANGSPLDSARATSDATFVILSSDVPRKTLLYQNFPNPFPAPMSSITCFWFDLRASDIVHLDVYDIRGNLMRTIVPGPGVTNVLPAGAYGRNLNAGSGCDPRFSWDGTAANGRVVPQGVYVVRLRANGIDDAKKIVFLGR